MIYSFDEKLQTHYYYNEETKNTQWEHPLDTVYRDLVKKARDASMHDDTCASVQVSEKIKVAKICHNWHISSRFYTFYMYLLYILRVFNLNLSVKEIGF